MFYHFYHLLKENSATLANSSHFFADFPFCCRMFSPRALPTAVGRIFHNTVVKNSLAAASSPSLPLLMCVCFDRSKPTVSCGAMSTEVGNLVIHHTCVFVYVELP